MDDDTRRQLDMLVTYWESIASRPNGIYEQCARDVRAILNADMHKHYWKKMEDLKNYSPSSYRYCEDCKLVQVLTFDGWKDFARLTNEVSSIWQ